MKPAVGDSKENRQVSKEVSEIVNQVKMIQGAALKQYTPVVEAVIAGRITDERQIELIMDGMMDFGDDKECFELYRKLCRHMYNINPKMVTEHVLMFRSMHVGK